MTRPIIIAEIGSNHNGSVVAAVDMIKIAIESGATYVKFQKRNPDACIPEAEKDVTKKTPWGDMSYLDYRKKLEFGSTEYDIINNYCKKHGVGWSASVWDMESLRFISRYPVKFIKIPSSMLLNTDLVFEAAKVARTKDIPIIFSIGMSKYEDITMAMSAIISAGATFHALNCCSSYPHSHGDSRLGRIAALDKLASTMGAGRLNLGSGYSGHESDCFPTILAAALGAKVIERHFTTDKTMFGSDQKMSLNPHQFKEIVMLIDDAVSTVGESVFNDDMFKPLDCEKKYIRHLRK